MAKPSYSIRGEAPVPLYMSARRIAANVAKQSCGGGRAEVAGHEDVGLGA